MMLGRETKILLTLLGTLSSGFVGVLGSKLFVPRPPTGTGPDVHLPARDLEDGPIVEPPSFERLGRSMFSATDPLPGDPGHVSDGEPAGDDLAPPAFADAGSRFGFRDDAEPLAEAGAGFDDADAAMAPDDADAGFDQGDMLIADGGVAAVAFESEDGGEGEGDFYETPRFAAVEPDEPAAFVPPADAMPIVSGGYVVTAADTWWDIAERAYGDGRYYKPLFAWNRSLDPRVTLAPGTRLEVPPLTALTTAHAELVPGDLAAVPAPNPVMETAAVMPVGNTVVVRPGDTLISIAREQLGASSRWRELYEANREALGRSPGPLVPGTQLVLP